MLMLQPRASLQLHAGLSEYASAGTSAPEMTAVTWDDPESRSKIQQAFSEAGVIAIGDSA